VAEPNRFTAKTDVQGHQRRLQDLRLPFQMRPPRPHDHRDPIGTRQDLRRVHQHQLGIQIRYGSRGQKAVHFLIGL
jgi:hypothetical protein